MMHPIKEFVVSSKKQATRKMKENNGRWPRFDSCISIGDPGQKPPYGFRFIPYRMRLEFDDVDSNEIGFSAPCEDDISRILNFAQLSKTRGDQSIIVNCEAGISRSTAAAYIFLCHVYGIGKENEAMLKVIESSEVQEICPNELMIKIADKKMKRNGKMIKVFDYHFPELPSPENLNEKSKGLRV